MGRKKQSDPRAVALSDQARRAVEAWQRDYRRLRRAWNRTEKSRRTADRAQKRLTAYLEAQAEGAAAGKADGP